MGEKTEKTQPVKHWLHGLGALCGASGTVTITWSPTHITCKECEVMLASRAVSRTEEG